MNLVRGLDARASAGSQLCGYRTNCGSIVAVVENVGMRSRVASLEANRREMESREQALRQQFNSQQRPDSIARIPQQQSPPSERAPVIASLVLMPGLSRDQSRVPRLILSPSAQIASIEIQLEPRDDFPRFRAELRTRSGEDVLVAGSLRRRRTGGLLACQSGCQPTV